MPKPENKPIIAVDIDDVVANENEGIRTFANREFGFSHTPEDYLADGEYWGYWESIWKVNPGKAKEIYEAFLNSPDKANLKVVEGAPAAISELKKNYSLVVVTSRNGAAIPVTRPWLERHFPQTFRQVEFVAAWTKHPGITKAIICKEIGADYLIDDNAEHCNLASEEGVRSLLFGDFGWNRNSEIRPGVTRVKNWQEVLEYFDGEAKQTV